MPAFLTWILRLSSRRLARELEGEVTDAFVELLLRGLKLAFWLLPDLRRNLIGFRGRYLLETAAAAVQVSALFEGGRMKVGAGARAALPLTFGSNTVVFRSWPEKLVRKGMHLAHLWIIDATEGERRRDGYDARTFFFVGKPARSVVPESAGQEVYQLNYRWRGLRTPPPDNLCVDEIVEIADGLHLGKLLYATNLLKPWDPDAPPREYDYRLFGHFLLMDPSRHALRLELGFDLDDT